MPKGTRELSQGDQSPVKRRRKDPEEEKSKVPLVFIPEIPRNRVKCETERSNSRNNLCILSRNHEMVGEQPKSGGRLTNIVLKNFMNHSRLDWSPLEYVNIITGPNGSGKSSILQAIVLGLGNV